MSTLISYPYQYLLVVTTSSTGWSPIPSWIAERHITTANGRDIFTSQPPPNSAKIDLHKKTSDEQGTLLELNLLQLGDVLQGLQQTVAVWIHRESRKKGETLKMVIEKGPFKMLQESAKLTAIEKAYLSERVGLHSVTAEQHWATLSEGGERGRVLSVNGSGCSAFKPWYV